MRNGIFLSIIFIICILQVTILDAFKISNVKPDLLLIAVVIVSIYPVRNLAFPTKSSGISNGVYLDLKWALVLAISAGILKDSLSANSFGINTVMFPLWGLLLIKLSKKISLESNFIRALLLFIVVVSHNIIIRLIYFYQGQQFIPLGIFLRTVFLESLFSVAILPLVSKLLKPVVYA